MRRVKNRDKIIFKCGQQKETCKFRLKRKLRVHSKELSIEGDKDNHHSPQLFFEAPELFQFTGSNSKLFVYNVTIHLRWSFGTVTNTESQVVFDQCKLLLKKRSYSLGVGADLRFIRARKYSILKLNFENSVIIHVKFNAMRVLNLILTEGLALSVDITVKKTTFNGNMITRLKSSGTGRLNIIESLFNYTTVRIEGNSQQDTWSQIKIQKSEFRDGLFEEQLYLKKLDSVEVEEVFFIGKEVDGLQSHYLNELSIKESLFIVRSTVMLSLNKLSITNTKLIDSSLAMQSISKATLNDNTMETSIVTASFVDQFEALNEKYNESSIELSTVKSFSLSSSRYIGYTLNAVKFYASHGSIRECSLEGSSTHVVNSVAIIIGSKFQDNFAINGGAIYNQNSSLVINETSFVNCSAKYLGGCIYSTDKGVTLNRVKFETSTTQQQQPSSFGSVIYSTAPINLNAVSITMKKSITSPAIYIKNSKEATHCTQSLSLLGKFELSCPTDHIIVNEIALDERNAFCGTNNLNFLSISCIKCQQGKANPNLPNLKNTDATKVDFNEINNTCASCLRVYPQIYTTEPAKDHSVRSANCPVVVQVPYITTECTNNHKIEYTRKCPEGYQLSIFSDECVLPLIFNEIYATIFWGCLIVVGILYASVLMYLKELVVIARIKGIYLQLKVVFEYYCSCCGKSDQLYYEEEEQERLREYQDNIDDEFDIVMVQPEHIRFTSLRFTMGTTLGVLKIIFFFYQVETLIRVPSPYKKEIEVFVLSIIRDLLSTLLSLRLNFNVYGFHFLPHSDFMEGDKEVTRATFGLWLLLPLILILFTVLVHCKRKPKKAGEEKVDSEDENENLNEERNQNTYEDIKDPEMTANEEKPMEIPLPKLKVPPMKLRFERIDGKVPIYVEQPLKFRMKCFLLLLLTLLYLPVSTLLLRGISCVNENGVSKWSIQDNVECFNGWQYLCMVLIALWVIPFPFAILFASKLQYTCKVNPNEFFFCLLFPPVIIVYYIRDRIDQYRRTINKDEAMMAKHLLMTLYEPFRLQKVDKRFDVMWDVAFLLRKLVLMVLAILAPISIRLYLVLAFLVFCTIHHVIVKPFSRELTNKLEVISLVALCLLSVVNIFWNHQSSCVDSSLIKWLRMVFVYVEYLILCAPLLVVLIAVPLAFLLACIFKIRYRRHEEETHADSTASSQNGSKDWKYPEEKISDEDEEQHEEGDDEKKPIMMDMLQVPGHSAV